MRKRPAIGLVLALAAFLAGSGLASGERIQLGRLIIDLGASFKPSTLPKKHPAPVGLRLRGDLSTVDGSIPPALTRLVLDFDRNGRLTTRGLPRCDAALIENATTPAAEAACRAALVGTGFASGVVSSPDHPPLTASSKVLAFNGTPVGGQPVLLLHAYALVPAPTTFVVPVVISRIHDGRYRYRSTIDAPKVPGGDGVITHFDLTLNRRYRSKGKTLSYLAARCGEGGLQVRGLLSFADGSSASGSIFRGCRTRK